MAARARRFSRAVRSTISSCPLALLALTLTACGVQRPLMRPKEIPAYEEQQRKKREAMEQETRELEAIDAKREATQ